MKANLLQLHRARPASRLAHCFALHRLILAHGAEKAPATDALRRTSKSYIKITWSGRRRQRLPSAAFQNRTRQAARPAAPGIEDLHIVKDVSKTTTATIDGEAFGRFRGLPRPRQLRPRLTSVRSILVTSASARSTTGVGGFFPAQPPMDAFGQPGHCTSTAASSWIEAKVRHEGSA